MMRNIIIFTFPSLMLESKFDVYNVDLGFVKKRCKNGRAGKERRNLGN